MKKVLIVAAHPDDEVLGCGATMAKHAKAGDDVHVLILAEGITSRDDKRAPGKGARAFNGRRGRCCSAWGQGTGRRAPGREFGMSASYVSAV